MSSISNYIDKICAKPFFYRLRKNISQNKTKKMAFFVCWCEHGTQIIPSKKCLYL